MVCVCVCVCVCACVSSVHLDGECVHEKSVRVCVCVDINCVFVCVYIGVCVCACVCRSIVDVAFFRVLRHRHQKPVL